MDGKANATLKRSSDTALRVLPTHPGARLRTHLMLCLLFFAVPPLTGQVNSGDVVGRVTDASGAVLPEAKVTIRNTGTGVSRTVQTGKTGDYSLGLLQVGTYEVTIEAKGFRTFVTKDLKLSAGDRVRVDGKLEIGTASESASVSAETIPALQTDSSTIGTSIPAEALAELPLNGRNLTNLVQLCGGRDRRGFQCPGRRYAQARPPSDLRLLRQRAERLSEQQYDRWHGQ